MAQIDNMEDSRFSCLAIFSSRIGFENSKQQKQDIQSFAKSHGIKIDTYIDSRSYDSLSVDQIAERFGKIQQQLVLTWRLDCLPNSITNMEDLFEVLSALGKKDISFLSIQDNLDTDSSVQIFSVSLHRAWLDFKRNRKITNGRASLAKAKDRQHQTGRKKVRDDSFIHQLRQNGLTIREIASKIGLSTTAVQRSLKTFKETPEVQNRLQPLV